MSDDIVTRLRNQRTNRVICEEASDEIERLRKLGNALIFVMESGSDHGWDEAIDNWKTNA